MNTAKLVKEKATVPAAKLLAANNVVAADKSYNQQEFYVFKQPAQSVAAQDRSLSTLAPTAEAPDRT